MKPLNELDIHLVEEAAESALAYGRSSSDAKALGIAKDLFRHLFLNETDVGKRVGVAKVYSEVLQLIGRTGADRGDVANAAGLIGSFLQTVDDAVRSSNWGDAANGVGIALAQRFDALCESDDGDQAIVWFQRALEYRPRKAAPKEWAQTQSNIANVILKKAKIAGDANLTEAAHDHFLHAEGLLRQSEDVLKNSPFKASYADLSFNRSIMYRDWSELEGDVDKAERAIEEARRAAHLYSHATTPFDWATARVKEAQAIVNYVLLSASANDRDIIARLREACDALFSVIDVLNADHGVDWLTACVELARVVIELQKFDAFDSARLPAARRALTAFEDWLQQAKPDERDWLDAGDAETVRAALLSLN